MSKWIRSAGVWMACLLMSGQGFAGTLDAGIVGPDGEVILFYKDGGQIIIKECADYTVLNSRNDCQLKSGTSTAQVPVEEFKNRLKQVLKFPVGNYDEATKRKIELFKKGKLDDIAKLEEQRAEVKSALDRIQAFINAYGTENASMSEKSSLESRLASIDSQLADNSELTGAIREINRLVTELVDTIIGGSTLHRYVFSKDKTGFEFNILRSYLQTPGLSASFAHVRAGTFQMGSPSSEENRDSDETMHQVTLDQDFQIQTTEVTQLQYFLVMGHNPSYFKESKYCEDEYIEINGTSLCPNHPVERVSWNDIKDFLRELDRSNDGYTYRLPTEAEWEYAARSGTATAFNLGENISPEVVNYDGNYPYKDAHKGVYRGQTVAVASLPNANGLGLYDMHGNVWEWTQDIYGDYSSGSVTDPRGASSGSYRVRRGGSWDNRARLVRSADRGLWGPDGRGSYVGLRLVRTPK